RASLRRERDVDIASAPRQRGCRGYFHQADAPTLSLPRRPQAGQPPDRQMTEHGFAPPSMDVLLDPDADDLARARIEKMLHRLEGLGRAALVAPVTMTVLTVCSDWLSR